MSALSEKLRKLKEAAARTRALRESGELDNIPQASKSFLSEGSSSEGSSSEGVSSSSGKQELVTITLPDGAKKVLEGELITLSETQGQKNKNEVSFEDLNEEQRSAVELGLKMKSFCLIGSAGSGKTTTQRTLLLELLNSGLIQKLNSGTKYLNQNAPSVLITSFTKVATRNIREAAPEAFKKNCINIHKALEFAPTKEEVGTGEYDDDGDEIMKEIMQFKPTKTADDPLPNITHCIIEESGSVDCELFRMLKDALPPDVIFIFLGDLNQLPPVYGAAILGFALQKLPTVELKHVYRQDIGPIKELANLVLDGKPLKKDQVESLQEKNTPTSNLKLEALSKKHDGPKLNVIVGAYMKREIEEGRFIEGESVVLCPIRKDTTDFLNVTEINRHIAQHLGEQRGSMVYEVITKSGFETKYYLSPGDLVFYEREYFKIVEINPNDKFLKRYGKIYQHESTTLNRWGVDKFAHLHSDAAQDAILSEISASATELLKMSSDDLDEAGNAPSHNIVLESWNPSDEVEEMELIRRVTLSSAGDIKALELGYAQTVHKAQGSEWKSVYCMFPLNCSFKINREILYTAITRARTNLTMLYEDGKKPYNINKGTFQAGIRQQAIKGNDLESKKAHFLKLLDKPEYSDILELL